MSGTFVSLLLEGKITTLSLQKEAKTSYLKNLFRAFETYSFKKLSENSRLLGSSEKYSFTT